MINISNQQRINIWKPVFPSTFVGLEMTYTVYSNDQTASPLFVGNFIYDESFELDATDWIEQDWDRVGEGTFEDDDLYVVINFTYMGLVQTVDHYFSKDKTQVSLSTYTIPTTGKHMELTFKNSDFKIGSAGYNIVVPLAIQNDMLKGKTINKITKTTYMDRYNDIHNSSADNKIELECYVDPDYIKILTEDDKKYTELMMVAQTARYTYLTGNANISGLNMAGSTTNLKCRVKDIEKIETYSRYNQSHPIPSLKIQLEIYR